jgi:GMP synthase (glutamine-hydrolysing)
LEQRFNPGEFVRRKLEELKDTLRGKKILLACSGGVCSNVAAELFRRSAEKPNVVPVLINTGFMRENEIENTLETLSKAPMKLDIRVVDARKKFSKAIEQSETGIEKRKMFYESFRSILDELANREGADLIALGTSATTKIVEKQIPELSSLGKSSNDSAIIVEPLSSLGRHQVAQVAQILELPPRLSDVIPFPALGLSIRALGKISDEKIKLARAATSIVEDELRYIKPSQYFAAVFDNKEDEYDKIEKVRVRISDLLDVAPSQIEVNIPECKMSAMTDGTRVYLRASAARATLLKSKEILEPDYDDITNFPLEFRERYKDFGRCLYSVTRKPKGGKYIAVIRAVSTDDFSKAAIARLEWNKLYLIAERIMNECGKVSSVYYDVTAKPPATIEFE